MDRRRHERLDAHGGRERGGHRHSDERPESVFEHSGYLDPGHRHRQQRVPDAARLRPCNRAGRLVRHPGCTGSHSEGSCRWRHAHLEELAEQRFSWRLHDLARHSLGRRDDRDCNGRRADNDLHRYLIIGWLHGLLRGPGGQRPRGQPAVQRGIRQPAGTGLHCHLRRQRRDRDHGRRGRQHAGRANH